MVDWRASHLVTAEDRDGTNRVGARTSTIDVDSSSEHHLSADPIEQAPVASFRCEQENAPCDYRATMKSATTEITMGVPVLKMSGQLNDELIERDQLLKNAL
jgi:predicted transcriptional regulator